MTLIDTDWELKRTLILRCAAEVFTKEGYDRGTTKQVAELAGLSQPSIYHYVGSKKEMLGEIAREVDRVFTAGFEEALAQGGTPVDQLCAALRNFVRDIIANMNAWAVYWDEQDSIPPAIAAEVQEHKRHWVNGYKDLVRQCQAEGALTADASATVLTEGILGSIATIYRWYHPGLEESPDEIADSLLSLFGLRTVTQVP